jgi:protein-tyrosine-phosphatase
MRQIAGDTVQVYSAGTKAATAANTLSAEAVSAVGVDITDQTPKPIDPQLVRDVDVVVTLGREARVEHIFPERASRTGTPTNPPNTGSMGSSACGWSATTSPPA